MVLGDILGDMPMESSDDDLEMPDSVQLAGSQEDEVEESQLTTRGRSDQREYAPAEDEDALRRGGRLAPAPDDFPDVGGGHPLVDLDDDNSIPMDLDSDTESAGPGCTLHDDSMTALAIRDPLTAGGTPKRGPRKRSKAARAHHAHRQQREYWQGALPAHAGLVPALTVTLDSLGMSEVPYALPVDATVAGQTSGAHTLDVDGTLVPWQSRQQHPT